MEHSHILIMQSSKEKMCLCSSSQPASQALTMPQSFQGVMHQGQSSWHAAGIPSAPASRTKAVDGEGVLWCRVIQEPVQDLRHLCRTHTIEGPSPLPPDQVLQ